MKTQQFERPKLLPQMLMGWVTRPNALAFFLGFAIAFTAWSRAHALTIEPTFDDSIKTDPNGPTIMATIQAAIALYENNFSDSITVKIVFKKFDGPYIGENWCDGWPVTVAYSDYLGALVSHATSRRDGIALEGLPDGSTNPVNENPNIDLKLPLAKALGFHEPTPDSFDGTIALWISRMNLSPTDNDSDKRSLFAVVCHEMDEVLGFGSALENDDYAIRPAQPEDLFRWDLDFHRRSFERRPFTAPSFSFDGVIHYMYFNPSKPGDYADWWGTDGYHVQDWSDAKGQTPEPDVELVVLDVIGYTRRPGTVWLDLNYTGITHAGSFNKPFVTFDEAASAIPGAGEVLNGGVIIKPGGTGGPLRLSTPMKLAPINGTVTLGSHSMAADPMAKPQGLRLSRN